ncbi:MAG TPA: hypothetical protein ENJ51_12300 [Leucothrix mucor]|uniref:Lipoprotein n=1 Tax=Leucothrix mucor TaxID=45248 RepID=A0A7V2T589_LEUMU|nr:hypothetical protein [Leucothrix mucor]
MMNKLMILGLILILTGCTSYVDRSCKGGNFYETAAKSGSIGWVNLYGNFNRKNYNIKTVDNKYAKPIIRELDLKVKVNKTERWISLVNGCSFYTGYFSDGTTIRWKGPYKMS